MWSWYGGTVVLMFTSSPSHFTFSLFLLFECISHCIPRRFPYSKNIAGKKIFISPFAFQMCEEKTFNIFLMICICRGSFDASFSYINICSFDFWYCIRLFPLQCSAEWCRHPQRLFTWSSLHRLANLIHVTTAHFWTGQPGYYKSRRASP